MIRSFQDKNTESVFNRLAVRKYRAIQEAAQGRLIRLHRAQSLKDLRALPGNRLEKLSGDRLGQYSIRVNDQYRICFRWREGEPWDVELVDYH